MRYSRQRELILKAVGVLGDHPTAEAIYSHASEQSPGLSLGTVYRNLNVLAQTGAIRRVSVPGQADRFDHTLRQHSHLFCTCCGRVEDLQLNDLAIREILRAGEPAAEEYELVAFGVCSACKHTDAG